MLCIHLQPIKTKYLTITSAYINLTSYANWLFANILFKAIQTVDLLSRRCLVARYTMQVTIMHEHNLNIMFTEIYFHRSLENHQGSLKGGRCV